MKSTRYLILAVLTSCWALASWMGATWYASQKTETLLATSQESLKRSSLAAFQAFDAQLNFLATVPVLAGQLPAITQAAARYSGDPTTSRDRADRKTYWLNRPDLQMLNAQLVELATSHHFDLAFMLNADGYSIASSNSKTPTSTIGISYQDRKYYQKALAGGNAQQYAVGRTTNIPGFFYAAPIRVKDEIVGVFAIKADITRFQALLSPYSAFLTDNNGVIVLASNPALLNKRLDNPGFLELSEEERLRLYRRTDFPVLQVSAWSSTPGSPLHRVHDLPYPILMTDRSMPVGGLVLHSYQGLPELLIIQHEQVVFAILMMLSGLAVFGLSYQLIQYLHNLRLSKTHAEAESERLHVTLTDREREIRRLAFVDTLTNLPNRNALRQQLNRSLHESSRRGQYGAVFLVNLDGLKLINERLGHDVGDQLLITLAGRLCDASMRDCYVARLGGDEFIAVHETEATSIEEAIEAAKQFGNRLLDRITAPYLVHDHTIHLTASVSVTLFGSGLSNTMDALHKEVDAAMFEAKHSQRGGIHFFDEQVRKALERRSELADRLLNALRNDRFEQVYQPQIDAQGRVAGVEALIRWQDDVLGQVSPAVFIPLAESLHIIADIDRWVLNRVCRTAGAWQSDPTLKQVPISVNVSGEFFSSKGFIDVVTTGMTAHGVQPEQLMIELTEGTLIAESEQNQQTITALHRQGIKVAIDDFGTGNSSLSYMRRFNVDQLKIDQSFVRDMMNDERSFAVVEFIIKLARSLKYHTLAEGVETTAQHETLAAMGCTLFQGYLFSKPLAQAECEAYIQASAAAHRE